MNTENDLLKQASSEIKKLRTQNAHMSGRLSMFDDMMLMFRSRPDFPQSGMAEDLVWKIDEHIQKSEKDGTVKSI